MATLIPYIFAQPNWYSLTYIARRLNKPLRTVQYWCTSGLFTRRGCKVALIKSQKHHMGREYWVQFPIDKKDIFLDKVNLPLGGVNERVR